jgi:hypothetical protein
MPKRGPLELAVEGEHLRLGSETIACAVCRVIPEPVIELPLDAPLLPILALRHEYSEDVIMANGLLKRLRAAEKERDALIAKAAETLEPLGVWSGDLFGLVEESTKRMDRP